MTSGLASRMALAFDGLGQTAAGDEVVETHLAASPTDRHLNRVAAQRAARRGDWARSRALLEYLALLAPRDVGLLAELAEARARTGDKGGAEQAAAAAYALRRGSPALTRGYAETASSDLAAALRTKAERFAQ